MKWAFGMRIFQRFREFVPVGSFIPFSGGGTINVCSGKRHAVGVWNVNISTVSEGCAVRVCGEKRHEVDVWNVNFSTLSGVCTIRVCGDKCQEAGLFGM